MRPDSETTRPSGIDFPAADDGRRSTSRTAKAILARAAAVVDPGSADAIRSERNWRKHYAGHFLQLTGLGLESPEAAGNLARAALEESWQQFVFQGPEGPQSLHNALNDASPRFRTLQMEGRSTEGPAPWAVPVGGETLTGDRLRVQIERWLHRGILEPGAAEALHRCLDNPEWFDLSDRTFVLLGAASEAGPLSWLARWRANIAAVDLPGNSWQRILDTMAAGNGVLYAPVRANSRRKHLDEGPGEDLGADLLDEPAAISLWLKSIGGPQDIGCLAYLHGEKHTRVSMAMDMIASALMDHDPASTLGYMATPTDSFAVPEAVAQRVQRAWHQRSLPAKLAQLPLRPVAFKPGITRTWRCTNGKRYGIIDSTILQQGPNYALAKRLQQWRAVVARLEGRQAVMNIAPSTTTRSVVSHPALAAGFAGADLFDVEVFEPATTNALMAALWVHELRFADAISNPATPLTHPYELFMANAIHGGLWSVPYLPRSVLPFAAAAGFVRQQLQRRS